MKRPPTTLLFSAMLMVFTACATPAPQAPSTASSQPSSGSKQIVAAVFSDPPGLHQ